MILNLKKEAQTHFDTLAEQYVDQRKRSQVSGLFSFKKNSVLKQEWNIEDRRDLRKKFEDLFMAVLPKSYKQDVMPGDHQIEFKV